MTTAWTRSLVGAILAAVAVVVTKLVGIAGNDVPVADLLGTTSLAFVFGGALFGWPGLVGAAATHALWTGLRTGGLVYPLLSTLLYVAAGALVYRTFRRVDGIGRGLPDLRSVAWYGGASAAGALLTSFGLSVAFGSGDHLDTAAVWARTTVVSVWVFGPALLILGSQLPARWLAPIPGEVSRRARDRYDLETGPADEAARVVRRPDAGVSADLWIGAVWLVAIAAVSLVAGRYAVGAGSWVALLYLIPIYWATRRHRLAGGLISAAGTGIALIVVEALRRADSFETGAVDRQLDVYVSLLIFLAVGALLGQARERETLLLEALRRSNRLLRRDLDRVVRALSGAVEAKDVYTEGHLRRVSSYALEVGRRLGLSGTELEHLQIASALHDVGKIGVPEHILNKPGALDEQEREVIERHPEIGARILDAVDGLSPAAPLVLHHQERWDGRKDGTYRGYPAGIAGEAIPLGARTIAVVDAFDAMTTDRAYRAAWTPEAAAEELRRERGCQFDPEVVDVFLELLEQRPWGRGP